MRLFVKILQSVVYLKNDWLLYLSLKNFVIFTIVYGKVTVGPKCNQRGLMQCVMSQGCDLSVFSVIFFRYLISTFIL